MNILIPICYLWSFVFLLGVVHFILREKEKFNFLIGITLFGNSFSLVFWPTTLIAIITGSIVFQDLVLQFFGCISIAFFVIFVITGIQLRLDATKRNCPN